MNLDAAEVLERLKTTFSTPANLLNILPYSDRCVPIGIEIEVPWRTYFPDLWIDGFPNIESNALQRITEICTQREQALLPMLQKTVECGVRRGIDRYWEFAFPPTTNVAITTNQIMILAEANLLPWGKHSLHVTLGNIKSSKQTNYLLSLMEAYCSSAERIQQGFGDHILSKRWARKGRGGVFQKEGEYDLMYGYTVASELRTLQLPDTVEEMFNILDTIQIIAELINDNQSKNVIHYPWINIMKSMSIIFQDHGLPDSNWLLPHQHPEIWNKYIDNFASIRQAIISINLTSLKDYFNDTRRESRT